MSASGRHFLRLVVASLLLAVARGARAKEITVG